MVNTIAFFKIVIQFRINRLHLRKILYYIHINKTISNIHLNYLSNFIIIVLHCSKDKTLKM